MSSSVGRANRFVFLLLAACSGSGCYESRLGAHLPGVVQECPTSPLDSVLAWAHAEGPDFGVCMAMREGTEDTKIGVYFGHHPDFDQSSNRFTERGQIDGRPVTWYDLKGEAFGREALLERAGEDAGYAHFWIVAQSHAELDQLKAVAAGIDLARKATVQRELPPL